MLDVISGGRIISGFVRGTGMEYYSYGANPSYSQERFWEAHDLIIKAWTEPGPFPWQGKHFRPAVREPVAAAAAAAAPAGVAAGLGLDGDDQEGGRAALPVHDGLRAAVVHEGELRHVPAGGRGGGYEASPKQLAAAIPTYVAETEEQAHREAKPHMMWLFQNGLKIPPYHWFPPGYTSKKSFAGMLGAKVKHNMKDHWDLTYEELLEERYIIVGSPETVIERLTEFTDDLGAGIVLGAGGHMGSMPHWLVMKNTLADGRGGDPALPRAGRQAELGARGPARGRAR